MAISIGMQFGNQVFTWDDLERGARLVEDLGYDHLWSWEHVMACMGDPYQDTFDAYTLVAAWATMTSRVRLGVLTGANTFRNPGLLAKMVTTLDHISGGRAILGLGAGWFEPEHTTYGFEFGSGFGERLDWLDESTAALRALFDGESVTSPEGGRYQLRDLRLQPMPVQPRLPILIGGGGEKKTLRTVAKDADMWNWVGTPKIELAIHKDAVLRERCDEIGRDHTEIERTVFCNPIIRQTAREAERAYAIQLETNRTTRQDVENSDEFWVGAPEQIAELMIKYRDAGFTTFIGETAAPLDVESIERFAREVKPMVDAA